MYAATAINFALHSNNRKLTRISRTAAGRCTTAATNPWPIWPRCTIRVSAAGSPTTVTSTRRSCVRPRSGSTPLCFGRHVARSSGYAIRPEVREIKFDRLRRANESRCRGSKLAIVAPREALAVTRYFFATVLYCIFFYDCRNCPLPNDAVNAAHATREKKSTQDARAARRTTVDECSACHAPP